LALLLPLALVGCHPQPPISPIVGVWSGQMTTGNLNLMSRWELRGDGTEAVSLTLPQGLLTTQGTFTFHDGLLTRRTTGRVFPLNGQKKTMPLVNPMETTYHCRLTGDTLTLSPFGTQTTIILTREKQ
jgi:hypothetical protein